MQNVKNLKIPVEVYSRVVGYFRPVQCWNKGKQQEFHDRKPYKMPEIINAKQGDRDDGIIRS